ncbi:hypothetical protein CDAR_394751 [Caerostris darwini]|uniref:Uncharacterized protein n=1 Tax=Caerostris darwini TaxID=1538125 RepID=A0AAV4SPT0_9ARAC|nr:hypothetical protein CDAR_394751 [Caerostris darwini]
MARKKEFSKFDFMANKPSTYLTKKKKKKQFHATVPSKYYPSRVISEKPCQFKPCLRRQSFRSPEQKPFGSGRFGVWPAITEMTTMESKSSIRFSGSD